MSNKRSRQDSNPSRGQHDGLASPQTLLGGDDASYGGDPRPGKYTYVDMSVESSDPEHSICCTLPPHESLGFQTYDDYEIHYQKSHVNRCIECNRNFPTDHFLDLHIAENHDPLNAAKRDRGEKIYHCFVEGCDKVCRDWQKRRMHLVAAHMFPRNYDFFIVNDGLDNRSSMLRLESRHRRQNSASSKATHSFKEENTVGPASHVISPGSPNAARRRAEQEQMGNHRADTTMDDIANSMAALKFVPKSVTFGRRQGGGLAKS